MKIECKMTLAFLALIGAISTPTSKVEGFLAGAKGSGMGFTGIAFAQDAYAGAYNPAVTIDVSDRFDISFSYGYEHGNAKVHTKNPPPVSGINGKFNAFDDPNVYIIDGGINKNFHSTIWQQEWDWSVGLVSYNRDYEKTTYKKPLPLLGTTKPGLEYIHEVVAPLFSVRLTDEHTFGISLDVNIQRFKVNGVQQFANAMRSLYPEDATNRGYAYSSGVGGSFGWKWDAYEGLSFGVVYRTKVHMCRIKKYKGFLAEKGRLNSPERWGIGLAYQALPSTTFTFDFEWINWQSIKAVHNPLEHNGAIEKLGTTNGPGFGFKNQTIYRFGLAYDYNENLTLRAGYRYGTNFIRRSQTAVNLLICDTVKNYITLGATYAWKCHNELTVFYAHGFENTIRGKNSIPATFGSGNVNLTKSNEIVGISWGYLF